MPPKGPFEDDKKEEPVFAEERQDNATLAKKIRDLENALAASRAASPLTLIPEHGAGKGDEIAETWSQYDQEQARA